MELWRQWWSMTWQLRPACSRLRSFLWFATCVAGMTVRADLLGVTSTIRALGLEQQYYDRLLDSFHSSAIKLAAMTALWTKVVLRCFPALLQVNGRLVLVGDGIKIAKRGHKMPAVKLLHQHSDASTKPEYIMGHSFQAVAVLVSAAKSVFAVPLTSRIHEGVVRSNRGVWGQATFRTPRLRFRAWTPLKTSLSPFPAPADDFFGRAWSACCRGSESRLPDGSEVQYEPRENRIAMQRRRTVEMLDRDAGSVDVHVTLGRIDQPSEFGSRGDVLVHLLLRQ